MKWLIDNWSLLVVLVAVIVVVVCYVKKFSALPSQEQQAKIKAWLLAIVVEAERQFGGQTGKIKLSWAYSKFVEAFPSLAPVVPFELFSSMVDEVLEQMRNLLESNESIRKYVEGE